MARAVHEAVHDLCGGIPVAEDVAAGSSPEVLGTGTHQSPVPSCHPICRSFAVGIDVREKLPFHHICGVGTRDFLERGFGFEGGQAPLGPFFIDHLEQNPFDVGEEHLWPLR